MNAVVTENLITFDHTYITTEKDWVGGSRKLPVLLTFSIVSILNRVGGSEKAQKYADVIYGRFLTDSQHDQNNCENASQNFDLHQFTFFLLFFAIFSTLNCSGLVSLKKHFNCFVTIEFSFIFK